MKIIYLPFILFLINLTTVNAQDTLETKKEIKPEIKYTTATFKTTRVVNAQSVENPQKGVLIFLIQHRFGALNTGAYNFFGLDQSTIRLGFEYGITKHLAVGIGRNSHLKTFDGYVKYKILRQSTGARNMPVSISYYGSADITSLTWADQGVADRNNYFSSRVAYTNQILIARRFKDLFSLQLMPTLVHKNLVKYGVDKNDIFSLGLAGSINITKHTALNIEYFFVFPNQMYEQFDNSLSLSFDIETGGHVFQLVFTNAKAIYDSGYITDTHGKWSAGDIYFGFNISRSFRLSY